MKKKSESIKRIESSIIATLGEAGFNKLNNAIKKKTKKLAKEVVRILANEQKKEMKATKKNNKDSDKSIIVQKGTNMNGVNSSNPKIAEQEKTISEMKENKIVKKEINKNDKIGTKETGVFSKISSRKGVTPNVKPNSTVELNLKDKSVARNKK